MSHERAGGGELAPDNARQMIDAASAFAQREMLPEARQALQRARNALTERSDVGPAHWCNACLVALEIAARGGDVQEMETEAAQLRSLSGGGQYWSEQARVRIGKSAGRVDPGRLDRVHAVLGGTAPATPDPAAGFPVPPGGPDGVGRGLISPTPRPSAPPEPPQDEGERASALALVPTSRTAEPVPAHEMDAAPERLAEAVPADVQPPVPSATPVPPRRELLPTSWEAPADPACRDPERAFWGAVWGATWQGSVPMQPPAGCLGATSVSTSAPREDAARFLPGEAGDRPAALADAADRDLPLASVHDGSAGARLRVAPDRTDAPELLHSFVDHVTCWRDDVSDQEAEKFYDLGTSFLEMEQWESAVRVFDQAMRNAGMRLAAAEGYLRALMAMGDHHAAFGAAGMALGNLAGAGEPLAGILFLRGRAAEHIGDPREARRCYHEALRIDRFYADARERLAALED